MARLVRRGTQQVLITELSLATSLMARMRGLLGTSQLADNQALLIYSCNSIHTFLMKYAIDCVFIDKEMRITKIVENVKPGRLAWSFWQAVAVIEMKAGGARRLGLQQGDQFDVGA